MRRANTRSADEVSRKMCGYNGQCKGFYVRKMKVQNIKKTVFFSVLFFLVTACGTDESNSSANDMSNGTTNDMPSGPAGAAPMVTSQSAYSVLEDIIMQLSIQLAKDRRSYTPITCTVLSA